MAKEKEAVVAPVKSTDEVQKQILGLTSHKHVKIWLLHDLCLLKNNEIAHLLSTNAGVVGNALKMYGLEPDKITKAKELLK